MAPARKTLVALLAVVALIGTGAGTATNASAKSFHHHRHFRWTIARLIRVAHIALAEARAARRARLACYATGPLPARLVLGERRHARGENRRGAAFHPSLSSRSTIAKATPVRGDGYGCYLTQPTVDAAGRITGYRRVRICN